MTRRVNMEVGAHSCLERLVTLDTDQEIRVPIPYGFFKVFRSVTFHHLIF